MIIIYIFITCACQLDVRHIVIIKQIYILELHRLTSSKSYESYEQLFFLVMRAIA